MHGMQLCTGVRASLVDTQLNVYILSRIHRIGPSRGLHRTVHRLRHFTRRR